MGFSQSPQHRGVQGWGFCSALVLNAMPSLWWRFFSHVIRSGIKVTGEFGRMSDKENV